MELHIAKKGFGVWAVGLARKAKRNCVVYSQEKKKEKKGSDEDRNYYLVKQEVWKLFGEQRGNDQHHEQGRHSTGRAVGKRYFLFPGLRQN